MLHIHRVLHTSNAFGTYFSFVYVTINSETELSHTRLEVQLVDAISYCATQRDYARPEIDHARDIRHFYERLRLRDRCFAVGAAFRLSRRAATRHYH